MRFNVLSTFIQISALLLYQCKAEFLEDLVDKYGKRTLAYLSLQAK